MNNDLMFSSKSEMWETPQAFFDDLNNLFQFTLDACATPENAKCERYFTPQFRAWEIKVWWRKEQCPIPKHGGDFSPPRESATLGRDNHVHWRTI